MMKVIALQQEIVCARGVVRDFEVEPYHSGLGATIARSQALAQGHALRHLVSTVTLRSVLKGSEQGIKD